MTRKHTLRFSSVEVARVWLGKFDRIFTLLPTVHTRTRANLVNNLKEVFIGFYFGILESGMRLVHSEFERFVFWKLKFVFLSLFLLQKSFPPIERALSRFSKVFSNFRKLLQHQFGRKPIPQWYQTIIILSQNKKLFEKYKTEIQNRFPHYRRPFN